MALSVTFLTIAVPLHMELNGITLLWAVEGPLLLYLGYRYDYRPIRTGAFAILLLTQMRIFLRHWPLHEAAFTLLLNRRFAIAMSAVLSAAAIAVIHKAWTHRRTKPDKMLMITSAIGAGYIALVTMHAELGKWLESDVLMSRGVVSVLWLMGTVAFLGVGVAVKSEIVRKAGIPALATGALLAARLYATAMEEPSMLYLNLRFIVGIAAVLTVFAYAMTLYRRKDICTAREQSLSKFLLCAGGAALLVLLSVETYTFFSREVTGARKARWVARMSLSIVWVVYAIGALLLGFWKRLRPLRLAALGLFGLTVGKLILMDITGIREIYRILSFFITGTLLIAAAYLYSKFEKRIEDLLGEKE